MLNFSPSSAGFPFASYWAVTDDDMEHVLFRAILQDPRTLKPVGAVLHNLESKHTTAARYGDKRLVTDDVRKAATYVAARLIVDAFGHGWRGDILGGGTYYGASDRKLCTMRMVSGETDMVSDRYDCSWMVVPSPSGFETDEEWTRRIQRFESIVDARMYAELGDDVSGVRRLPVREDAIRHD